MYRNVRKSADFCSESNFVVCYGGFLVSEKMRIFVADMRRFIVIMLLALAVAVAEGATQRWERVDTPVRVLLEGQRADDEAVEVAVSEGYVYVEVQAREEVRVFTILGQLISQESLQPGTYRFHLASRGIYILKIGTITRRVTI